MFLVIRSPSGRKHIVPKARFTPLDELIPRNDNTRRFKVGQRRVVDGTSEDVRVDLLELTTEGGMHPLCWRVRFTLPRFVSSGDVLFQVFERGPESVIKLGQTGYQRIHATPPHAVKDHANEQVPPELFLARPPPSVQPADVPPEQEQTEENDKEKEPEERVDSATETPLENTERRFVLIHPKAGEVPEVRTEVATMTEGQEVRKQEESIVQAELVAEDVDPRGHHADTSDIVAGVATGTAAAAAAAGIASMHVNKEEKWSSVPNVTPVAIERDAPAISPPQPQIPQTQPQVPLRPHVVPVEERERPYYEQPPVVPGSSNVPQPPQAQTEPQPVPPMPAAVSQQGSSVRPQQGAYHYVNAPHGYAAHGYAYPSHASYSPPAYAQPSAPGPAQPRPAQPQQYQVPPPMQQRPQPASVPPHGYYQPQYAYPPQYGSVRYNAGGYYSGYAPPPVVQGRFKEQMYAFQQEQEQKACRGWKC